MTGSYLGKRSATLRAEHQAACDQAEIRTACLYCAWTFTGPAAEGRERALAHRTAEHPEAKATRRRRHSLQRFNVSEDSWRAEGLENARSVAEMHRRREGRAA